MRMSEDDSAGEIPGGFDPATQRCLQRAASRDEEPVPLARQRLAWPRRQRGSALSELSRATWMNLGTDPWAGAIRRSRTLP